MRYAQLKASLSVLPEGSEELNVIRRDVASTNPKLPWKLKCVWRVSRQGEAARFARHDGLGNRRLLWHGTSVAVVAAILKSGLRIMPRSGGRVGKGIYLADQHEKSASYTWGCKKSGARVMFLAEAALGTPHSILRDDPSIVRPPGGCDSVIAVGRTAPMAEVETFLEMDGKQVAVPQGEVSKEGRPGQSRFHHSEFLLYDEAQHRIRYVCEFHG